MQIKHITRVSLSAGRSSQQQGHLSVSNSLLGEIVINDQTVLSVISEVFSDSTSGVGGQELEGSGFRGSGGDDDGVVHGSMVGQGSHDVGNSRSLLSDGDVDTVELGTLFGIRVLE